jgi:beta-lactamase class D
MGGLFGWIEKDTKKIIWVKHIVDSKKEESPAGIRAKEQTREKLLQLIDSTERSKLEGK